MTDKFVSSDSLGP